MVQQDNKPNMETTVDGQPLFKGKKPRNSAPQTEEYINEYIRDDDPLLSETERADTRADILNENSEEAGQQGISHP